MIDGCPSLAGSRHFAYVRRMAEDRIAKLTEGQRACLRRVLAHQTSKDIARELGVSPHTVDQRLRVAARTLGVASRVEAARMLAEHENATSALYQPFVYQPSVVAPETIERSVRGTTAGDRTAEELEHGESVRERQLAYQAFIPVQQRTIALPFPLSSDDENKLRSWQRIGWIVAIAIAAALSFGAILSGLESLGSLMGSAQTHASFDGGSRGRH